MRERMTADMARENVAAMHAQTSRRAMIRMLQLALTDVGNLSDEAREVYRNALAEVQ